MSDLLASVLISAARGIVADHGGETGAKAPTTVAANPTTKPATQAAKATAAPAKSAAAQAAKPAAKPAKPAAAAAAATPPAKVGKYDVTQVRDIIRKVAQHEALGKQEALNILDEEAGVQNVSQLKPTDYDKVWEACNNALNAAGGTAVADETAAEEFDPTA